MSLAEKQVERFFSGAGLRVSTAAPLARAALAHLAAKWPQSIRFDELVAAACAAVEAVGQSGVATPPADVARLEDDLVQCCAGGIIEIESDASAFVTHVSERPKASSLARLASAARRAGDQSSARARAAGVFRPIGAGAGRRRARPRAQLVEQLARLAVEGQLAIWKDNQRLQDATQIPSILAASLGDSLARLARGALLIG